MLSQGPTAHVRQFYDDCKNGTLDDAYNLLPASFRHKVSRQEFKADFQNNLVTDYLLLTEKEGTDMNSVTINYTRQDGSNWSAEWLFERPGYDWLATEISVTQM